jgi:type VI protein secretion system component VasF
MITHQQQQKAEAEAQPALAQESQQPTTNKKPRRLFGIAFKEMAWAGLVMFLVIIAAALAFWGGFLWKQLG